MEKMVRIPKWTISTLDLCCEKCEIDFNSSKYEDEQITAVSSGNNLYYYCNDCYESIKNSKYEMAVIDFKYWFKSIDVEQYSGFTSMWIDDWSYKIERTHGIKYTLIGMQYEVERIIKIMSILIPDYILFEEIDIQLDKVISKFEGCW